MYPPSTGITTPVIHSASSDTRNATALATSCSRPIRPNGYWTRNASAATEFLVELLVHRRVDIARSHRVHPDATRGQFDRKTLGQSMEGRLRCTIGCSSRNASGTEDRAHENYASAPLLDHVGCDLLRQKERALYIYIESGVPLVFTELMQESDEEHARAIHEECQFGRIARELIRPVSEYPRCWTDRPGRQLLPHHCPRFCRPGPCACSKCLCATRQTLAPSSPNFSAML